MINQPIKLCELAREVGGEVSVESEIFILKEYNGNSDVVPEHAHHILVRGVWLKAGKKNQPQDLRDRKHLRKPSMVNPMCGSTYVSNCEPIDPVTNMKPLKNSMQLKRVVRKKDNQIYQI